MVLAGGFCGLSWRVPWCKLEGSVVLAGGFCGVSWGFCGVS